MRNDTHNYAIVLICALISLVSIYTSVLIVNEEMSKIKKECSDANERRD